MFGVGFVVEQTGCLAQNGHVFKIDGGCGEGFGSEFRESRFAGEIGSAACRERG